MSRLSVTIVGAGIVGLWQAFELALRGHKVTLREAMAETETGAASRLAGAMLAPFCESETAAPIVKELGLRSINRWRKHYSGMASCGSLVVAPARDHAELRRFARRTDGHKTLNAKEIAALEPDLADRFRLGLFFREEAHLAPRHALTFLVGELRRLGVELRFGQPVAQPTWLAASAGEALIDCRGISAMDELLDLRGVRGEMAVIHTSKLNLSRPIRLLHPRFPLYIVPWRRGQYMIGATTIESEHAGQVAVRSALELLSSACAIHPGFADADLLEFSAGIRPAFPSNVPSITVRGRHLLVNGAYRHGYLLAPALAEAVADFLERDSVMPDLFRCG